MWDLETCSILSVLTLDTRVQSMKLIHGCEVSVLLGLKRSSTFISVRSTSRTVRPATKLSKDADLFPAAARKMDS